MAAVRDGGVDLATKKKVEVDEAKPGNNVGKEIVAWPGLAFRLEKR